MFWIVLWIALVAVFIVGNVISWRYAAQRYRAFSEKRELLDEKVAEVKRNAVAVMDLNDDWRNAKPGMLKSVDELLEQREWVKYDKEQHSEEVHRRREKRQQEWADMDVVEYYEANLAKGAK